MKPQAAVNHWTSKGEMHSIHGGSPERLSQIFSINTRKRHTYFTTAFEHHSGTQKPGNFKVPFHLGYLRTRALNKAPCWQKVWLRRTHLQELQIRMKNSLCLLRAGLSFFHTIPSQALKWHGWKGQKKKCLAEWNLKWPRSGILKHL